MEFPKDHELFKDIKPDGTLEYTDGLMENLVKDNSYNAFYRAANKSLPETVKVSYLSDAYKYEPSTSEIKDAAKMYNASVFASGAEAAYNQTKGGAIGMFPVGTFEGRTYPFEGFDLHVGFSIGEQLKLYQPDAINSKDMQKLYSNAVNAKKDRPASAFGILFLLIHMAIIAICALSLLPDMEQYRLFGRGWDWTVIAGCFLALVIAWACHGRTCNEWMPLGFLHVFFSGMFLLWDMEEAYPVKYRLVLAGIALILSLISIIHYFIDGFGNYVRWRIQDFKDWCDKDAQENYRRLRFLILWYRNITGEKNTPFDAMEREFFATLAKRKEF